MSSDLPTNPHEALDPSLTALLLGELTEAQAEVVRDAIERDSALAKRFQQLKSTICLIREAEASNASSTAGDSSTPARLNEERRQQLLQAFKTLRPQQFNPVPCRESRWLVPAATACAVISIVVALLILGAPHGVRRMTELSPADTALAGGRKSKGVDTAVGNRGETLAQNNRSAQITPLPGSRSVSAPASAALSDTAVKLAVNGAVVPKEGDLAGGGTPNLATSSEMLDFDQQKASKIEESLTRSSGASTRAYHQIGGGGLGGAPVNQTLSFGDQPELGRGFNKDDSKIARREAAEPSVGRSDNETVVDALGKSELKSSIEDGKSLQENFGYRDGHYARTSTEPASAPEPANSANFYTFQTPQAVSPPLSSDLQVQKPAAAPPESIGRTLSKKAETNWKLNENAGGLGIPQLVEAGQEARNSLVPVERDKKVAQQVDKEDLGVSGTAVAAPQPLPEILTKEQPTSTFSLNVSDVAFRLAASSLEQGKFPAPGSIRSEEFLNAFNYRDPEPAAGQRVAFVWDRAAYPFAQNRDLLRLSVKTAAVGREPGRPLNLVLLLDNSGSMERADRVEIIRQALRVIGSQLRTNDTLSVVTFARTARLFADGVRADQAGRVAEELAQLPPQGGTNLEEAMNLAYQTALRHYLANGMNRVVLLTDGAANLGNTNPETLKQQVEANRKEGIALDCFGIGWEGYNDDLLEQLTRHGDGRYGFLNTPQEAATEFADKLAGALQVAAVDVKVQVEFNKARVTSFRQIGYAQHQLKTEQFRDNTVDAAEIGGGESGNALYGIETAPLGEGPIGVFRVRYKVPGTSNYREQEWTIPYTGTATPLDKAGAGTRLAAVGSAFAEWLAGSPYAAEVNPDQLLSYLKGVPAEYGVDPRPHKLEWMLQRAKALGGK